MTFSQADLDRLFPAPLVPHCEGCHPFGEKAAETFLEDPETGTRMACDSGGPHTHRLCRRHINGGEVTISTGHGRAGGDPYGRSSEELAGEERRAAPGDRPEGASPPHPRERGLHWAPSAPQSPAKFRRLYVGICETHVEAHHSAAKQGGLEVQASYPVTQDRCILCLFQGRDEERDRLAKELKQAQGWVNTIKEQRDAARAETRSFQKELAEVRESYLGATRRVMELETIIERSQDAKTLKLLDAEGEKQAIQIARVQEELKTLEGKYRRLLVEWSSVSGRGGGRKRERAKKKRGARR